MLRSEAKASFLLLVHIYNIEYMVGVKKKFPVLSVQRVPVKKKGQRTGIEQAMNGTDRSVCIPVSF